MINLKNKIFNLPVIVIIFGCLIRIFGYTSTAIRYDEALSLYRATIPFAQFLHDQQYYSSLILWEFILRLVAKLSHALWVVRLPSVVFGLFSLFLIWKLIVHLKFSIRQQLFVLFIIAFCPGLIWISQDARQYILFIDIYLLSIIFALEKKWLGLFAVCSLSIYTHVIGPAFALGALSLAIIQYPKNWKRILIIGVSSAVIWCLWLVLYFNIQPTTGFSNEFWLGNLGITEAYRNIFVGYFISMPDPYMVIIFMATLIISVIFSIYYSIRNRGVCTIIFLVPLIAILLESLIWKNTLFWRTIILLIIPLILWIGQNLTLNNGKYFGWVIITLWIVITIAGVLKWNPVNNGGKLDMAAKLIDESWKNGDIIYFGTGTVAMPFNYYLNDKPEFLIDGITNSSLTPPTLHLFARIRLESIPYKRVWLIYPTDNLMPLEQQDRLKFYARSGRLITTIKTIETPDILVYLIE